MRKGLHMQPPPKQRPPVFRVVYVIDVGAGNMVKAAKTAYEMMTSSDSMPPIVEVIDNRGNKVRIDLSNRLGKKQQYVAKSLKHPEK
jgi:hypothetical protein